MEQILNYVKPELVVVAIRYYTLWNRFKNTEKITDKYIPSNTRCCWNYLSAVSTWYATLRP